jgi:ribosome-binding factor A
MPREFPRSRRLEEAIQRILSEVLAGRARDPRLSGVTVTDVSVTRDLGVARVYYTLLSGEPPGPEMAEALSSAAGFLRTAVARELRVRQVPELRFYPDQALLRARSLEALIERAVAGEHKKDVDPSGDPAE